MNYYRVKNTISLEEVDKIIAERELLQDEFDYCFVKYVKDIIQERVENE